MNAVIVSRLKHIQGFLSGWKKKTVDRIFFNVMLAKASYILFIVQTVRYLDLIRDERGGKTCFIPRRRFILLY